MLQQAWTPHACLISLVTAAMGFCPCLPACRLFAVGYALRQINSGAQLLRMLSNPPVPLGLCPSAKDWAMDLKRSTCRCCNRDLASAEKVGCRAVLRFGHQLSGA